LIASSGIRARVSLFNKKLLNLEARFPSNKTKKKLREKWNSHHRPFPEQKQDLPGFFAWVEAGDTLPHAKNSATTHGRTDGKLGAVNALTRHQQLMARITEVFNKLSTQGRNRCEGENSRGRACTGDREDF
jgi:hypothetical protein